MDLNKLEEAEKLLLRALAIDPQDSASLYLIGSLKFKQEKYDAALDYLALSARLAPNKAQTQLFLAKTLMQKGQRMPAEAALRKAIQLKPGWGDVHYLLAVIYATQRPPYKELAQWHYQKSLAGDPRATRI